MSVTDTILDTEEITCNPDISEYFGAGYGDFSALMSQSIIFFKKYQNY